MEALHKAAIVLLTAFWEAFCEDLAAEGLQHLVDHGTASSLPTELRKLVAKELREAKHHLAIWDLAGGGWRMVLERRLKRLKDDRNRKLNSPKSDKINELVENTVGIKETSKAWYWSKMPTFRAAEKLDGYIETRGAIAHRGSYDSSVRKGWVADYHNHVCRLVERTRVAEVLTDATGVPPGTNGRSRRPGAWMNLSMIEDLMVTTTTATTSTKTAGRHVGATTGVEELHERPLAPQSEGYLHRPHRHLFAATLWTHVHRAHHEPEFNDFSHRLHTRLPVDLAIERALNQILSAGACLRPPRRHGRRALWMRSMGRARGSRRRGLGVGI
ncbi:MAG: hypothetical protein J2O47_07990 [Acidimicrobiaceae bacterium]|nr:hypothetical protein [Acidimicrobiaceae bacterium]